MRTIAFIISGLAAGLFSGALGLGGALLATPLIRFLGVSPHLAIGTTVPVLLPTTLTGAWTYHRSGFVDLRAAGWTALAGAFGAVGGAFATRADKDGHVLMLMTAVVLGVLALRSLPRPSEQDGPSKEPLRAPVAFAGLGIVAGFFSGLLGIGGGFLLVPAFMRWFRLPIKTALGTSLAVITVTSIPNMVAQTVVGNVDWEVAGLLALGVIPGAFAGARLAIRADEKVLRTVVVVMVLALAVVYAVIEAAALFSA